MQGAADRSVRIVVVCGIAALVAAAGAGDAHAAHPGEAAGPVPPQLANGCVALRMLAGAYVGIAGDSYRLAGKRKRGAARFHVKPTGLRRFMLHDQGDRLLSAEAYLRMWQRAHRRH